jgi:hypothetical protein
MNELLPLLVSLIGLAVAGIGVLGMVAPSRLMRFLEGRRILTNLPVTLVVRVVTAVIFLLAAPDCRVPALVRLVGFLEVGGALVLFGMGAEGLGRFVEWWLGRPPVFVRYWCLAAFAFGFALFYAGGGAIRLC